MDERTLNDLLECSVCLERLDTSSKVLPCQHTFCKKCLVEIVQKHKELRCPECRVLVNSKIDDLPPNVLLMRILEGMKNKDLGSKKLPKIINAPASPAPISSNQVLHNYQQLCVTEHGHINKHPTQAISHLPYAKALYDYVSKEAGDLNFKRGDIIMLRKRIDSHWYQGECCGRHGVFPLSYVQVITPLPSHIPQCKALYDFRMTNDEEEGCLVFNKGDIINVIRRVDENWAEGKLDGRTGIFPIAFVEMNSLARSLMKLSSNAQPGPSKNAPPTPTADDSTPLIPTDHSRTIINQQRHNQVPLVTSDSSSTVSSGNSSTNTPNASSSNTSSTSSTAPSSPASPPSRNQPVLVQKTNFSTPPRSAQSPEQRQHNKEKRHSFTSLTPPQQTSVQNRHSVEILSNQDQASANPEKRKSGHTSKDMQLPAAYIALYSYKPQKADELELRKGGIYMVTERCQDGWYKGTSNRTQKCGVFPGNYVTLARGMPTATVPPSLASSDSKLPVSFTRTAKASLEPPALPPRCASPSWHAGSGDPPELPPRCASPNNVVSASWHGAQETAAGTTPLSRSTSAASTTGSNLPQMLVVSRATDKQSKERKEKSSVGLMRRLTSIKRSKSPPPTTYSMDNPVFEDVSIPSPKTGSPAHPIHVRSGSCPSQLLHVDPHNHRTVGSSSSSQRVKHKQRPSVLAYNSATRTDNPAGTSARSSPETHRHRKCNSLDANNKLKTGVQTVRERFRCIAPYPPNSEYELELQVNDIIYVHKKRDDGWYKGTQQRTGKTGLFPASFVESY